MFAGGHHSFVLLNDYLKRDPPQNDSDVNIPEMSEGLVAYKEDQDDLLGSFTPDEQV